MPMATITPADADIFQVLLALWYYLLFSSRVMLHIWNSPLCSRRFGDTSVHHTF
jgi:hypothetical protein